MAKDGHGFPTDSDQDRIESDRRVGPWLFDGGAGWKRMRSGDRPGLQNRRAAGHPVTGGFDPHSLPPLPDLLEDLPALTGPEIAWETGKLPKNK